MIRKSLCDGENGLIIIYLIYTNKEKYHVQLLITEMNASVQVN